MKYELCCWGGCDTSPEMGSRDPAIWGDALHSYVRTSTMVRSCPFGSREVSMCVKEKPGAASSVSMCLGSKTEFVVNLWVILGYARGAEILKSLRFIALLLFVPAIGQGAAELWLKSDNSPNFAYSARTWSEPAGIKHGMSWMGFLVIFSSHYFYPELLAFSIAFSTCCSGSFGVCPRDSRQACRWSGRNSGQRICWFGLKG